MPSTTLIDQPDEINNPIYYQHHSNYQTDSYNNSDLKENLDNLAILNTSGGDFNVDSNRLDEFNDSGCFDSFNDDGGFDDQSYFEDSSGSFDDRFANGGFDDGGFDNGSFDNGSFDDGGFDGGGFENGSFDDGYGSTYY
ncbi:hypothetical protein PGTUg99_010444 [Puccinia graminis f. sp. tritici]|uniref:Uncharacterized protein n=1 Tax=Puccinia graminis f. sp. tritici TaxID=56615 RepID=A0A5B0RTD0_PUCGR|nr:hypothetical protein PGTUg99_010444 [Puccinia graminis f. sp. tritici]